jgi:hypothetical protein
MDRHELVEAIQRAQREDRSPSILDRCRARLATVSRRLGAAGHLALFAVSGGRLVSALRAPRPARVLVLSLAMLATGGLGLMVAYAVAPEEEVAAQVLTVNGRTVRITTVTGPGGTTTFAVTTTRQGKAKLVPVRILRTVTGPGGTRILAVPVTHQQVVTQVHQNTETQVVTQVEPVTVVVTDVVTQLETVVVTDTVVVEVTTTVGPGPP